MPSSLGRKWPAKRLGVRIDQPRPAVEALALLRVERAVGLEVIELAGADARDEHAPNIAPAVGLAVELDDFRRLAVVDLVVQQQPHRRGRSAEDDKLHAAVVQNRAVGQRVTELQSRVMVRLTFGTRLLRFRRECEKWVFESP